MKKPYRKRYILFEVISEEKIDAESVFENIKKAIKELFGDIGLSEANIKLLAEFSTENKHLLQIDHGFKHKTMVALATVKDIKGKKVILKSIKTYGTLKKIKGVQKNGRSNAP